MRNAAVLICVFTLMLWLSAPFAQAQTKASVVPLAAPIATSSAVEDDASASSKIASPSAAVQQKIQEKLSQDITQTEGGQKSKLVTYLDQKNPGPLSWNNFIQHSIRFAVSEGVPANIIVLVLLFPLIASLIAASRHIIGVRGFGLYIPAVLSVALVSTGIIEGLIIFLAIVVVAVLTKRTLRKTKLAYLPRTALLIWTISMGIFALILSAPLLNLVNLMSVNIFPILILVLLAENFLDAQLSTKQTDAVVMTLETLVLAAISGVILKWDTMQRFALTEPELLIVATAMLNVIIGKFTGLRVAELLRFRNLMEEDEE